MLGGGWVGACKNPGGKGKSVGQPGPLGWGLVKFYLTTGGHTQQPMFARGCTVMQVLVRIWCFRRRGVMQNVWGEVTAGAILRSTLKELTQHDFNISNNNK